MSLTDVCYSPWREVWPSGKLQLRFDLMLHSIWQTLTNQHDYFGLYMCSCECEICFFCMTSQAVCVCVCMCSMWRWHTWHYTLITHYSCRSESASPVSSEEECILSPADTPPYNSITDSLLLPATRYRLCWRSGHKSLSIRAGKIGIWIELATAHRMLNCHTISKNTVTQLALVQQKF